MGNYSLGKFSYLGGTDVAIAVTAAESTDIHTCPSNTSNQVVRIYVSTISDGDSQAFVEVALRIGSGTVANFYTPAGNANNRLPWFTDVVLQADQTLKITTDVDTVVTGYTMTTN